MSVFSPLSATKLNTHLRKHALLALATIAAACLCVPSAGASVARSSITPISSISVGGSQSTSRTATTGRIALPAGRGGSSGGSSGRSSSGSSSRRSSSSGSGSSSRRSSSGGSNSSGSGSSSRRNSWWGRSNSRSGSSNYYNRYYNNYDSDHSYDDSNNDTYGDPSYDDSTSDNSYSSQSYDNSGYSQEQQDMDSRFIPLAVIIVFVATGMFLIMIAGNSKDSARKPQPRFNTSPMNWLSGTDNVSNYYDISDDDTSYDSDSGDYDYSDDNSYDCDSGDYDYSDDNSYDSDTSDNSYYDC